VYRACGLGLFGGILASWFLLWKCERRPFFKATTAPTHPHKHTLRAGKDSKLGCVGASVCFVCTCSPTLTRKWWMILWFAWPEFYSMHACPPPNPPPLIDQPIASGKFYVCIRNWIFALVMEMRKLQLDLFFTGSLVSLGSSLFNPPAPLEFSSFFLWVCVLVRRKRFLATLGKLFEFPSFILVFRFVFSLVVGVHWFLVCAFALWAFAVHGNAKNTEIKSSREYTLA